MHRPASTNAQSPRSFHRWRARRRRSEPGVRRGRAHRRGSRGSRSRTHFISAGQHRGGSFPVLRTAITPTPRRWATAPPSRNPRASIPATASTAYPSPMPTRRHRTRPHRPAPGEIAEEDARRRKSGTSRLSAAISDRALRAHERDHRSMFHPVPLRARPAITRTTCPTTPVHAASQTAGSMRVHATRRSPARAAGRAGRRRPR